MAATLAMHDTSEDMFDEEAAWAAVIARDRQWDSRIVYAVRTTGVYCRPSCPSRRPHRENVAFFSSPQDAERSGFRACRRCRAHAVLGTPAEQRIGRAVSYIESHLDQHVTLQTLAREVGLSPYHLQRTFTRLVGLSPRAYAEVQRVKRLKSHLREGNTVSRATYEAGFGSTSGVYARADGALGMTPAAYRRGGRGMLVAYALVDAPLGRLLVAATERGVALVALGDDDAALEAAVRREYPNATVAPKTEAPQALHNALDRWVAAILAYLRGTESALAVPLDVKGTSFQRHVWQALQTIPYGETRSYSEVAQAIGAPQAVRAVASACAANPTALVVPCHRVVRTDGELGGYRWGIERKKALLAREGNAERVRA
jgi:AraC family transcriptional regulator, regulatory protein of adaptative response / methylated-DNA-[protein]-cysteine methyltransferase